MKVAIRVDSSTVIGSGHLMRCLTLAKRLRKENDAEVHFISRDLEGNLHEMIPKEGFVLHILPRHAPDGNLAGYAAWLTVPQAATIILTPIFLRNLASCLAYLLIASRLLLPYGTLPVSPKYTIFSCGIISMISRTAVSPPRPESKTPIALLFISIPLC